MQGAAGPGHQGRHAEFAEHVRGRRHLRRATHRMPAGAVRDPVQGGGVGGGQFGRDVRAQPLLVARGPCGVQGLDDRRGHALVEHAPQELLASREPGRAVEHLDAGAEGPQERGVGRGTDAAGQHRHAQAAPRHRGHHRDVGEGDACLFREGVQLSLGAGRGRVQVGPDDVWPQAVGPPPAFAGQAGLQRAHSGLRAVNAEHQVGPPRRVGLAGGVDDGFGGRHGRIVAADAHSGGGQVTRDDRTSLPQAEHRDDKRLPVPGGGP